MEKIVIALGGFITGVAIMYLTDPVLGRGRRQELKNRVIQPITKLKAKRISPSVRNVSQGLTDKIPGKMLQESFVEEIIYPAS